ncbi:MAG: N-acetylglucosamine-6-phosphate deacetylase [Lachnospiraceae bacterium]|nr:N-acetylglucosamine-6-phosphate deacetylase [Lachnospiraceae bacterium]
MKIITNGRLILTDRILEGKAIVFDDKIRAIVDNSRIGEFPGAEVIDAAGNYVSPGLVDVHCHGAGGDDTCDNKEGAIQNMSRLIAGYGVTSWLPTTMTMSKDHLRTTFAQIREAKKASAEDPAAWGGAQVLGANMEGPFINVKRKGAQAAEHVALPDFDYTMEFADVIKLLTIASEVEGGLEFIERITEETDIVCSLGHTCANYDDACACFKAGCNHVTHLFNAQSGLAHRDPGVVGAALANRNVYTEFIADTFHIHPGVFQIVADCKKDHLVLITDCMRAGGLPDGDYSLGGQPVVVKGIECRLEDGTIAGSVLRLYRAVQNLYKHTDVTLPQAVACASLNSARSIRVDDRKGSLEVGKDADILIADNDFEIINTFVGGHKVYGN